MKSNTNNRKNLFNYNFIELNDINETNKTNTNDINTNETNEINDTNDTNEINDTNDINEINDTNDINEINDTNDTNPINLIDNDNTESIVSKIVDNFELGNRLLKKRGSCKIEKSPNYPLESYGTYMSHRSLQGAPENPSEKMTNGHFPYRIRKDISRLYP